MERYSVDDDFVDFFHINGYVCFKDLFAPADVAHARRQICEIFECLLSNEGLRERELIAATYESHRLEWRACAKQMGNSIFLAHLASSSRLVDVLVRAGLRQPIHCIHPEARIDMPLDEQYTQPWHQDWRSGQGSLNAVTIWLPLHDVSLLDGAIEILAGTHFGGLLDIVEKQDPRRFEIVDPRLDAAKGEVAELCEGECLLFSQFLVHRSGQNRSANPRLTCQFRFADLCEPHYRSNLYRMPVGSELVWPELPRPQDIKRLSCDQ